MLVEVLLSGNYCRCEQERSGRLINASPSPSRFAAIRLILVAEHTRSHRSIKHDWIHAHAEREPHTSVTARVCWRRRLLCLIEAHEAGIRCPVCFPALLDSLAVAEITSRAIQHFVETVLLPKFVNDRIPCHEEV